MGGVERMQIIACGKWLVLKSRFSPLRVPLQVSNPTQFCQRAPVCVRCGVCLEGIRSSSQLSRFILGLPDVEKQCRDRSILQTLGQPSSLLSKTRRRRIIVRPICHYVQCGLDALLFPEGNHPAGALQFVESACRPILSS